MFLNLFKAIVRPHLEYATSVWSPQYKKDMIAIEMCNDELLECYHVSRAKHILKDLKP